MYDDDTDYRRPRHERKLQEGGKGSGFYDHPGNPGHVGGSRPLDLPAQIAKATIKNRGGTFSTHGEATPTSGYAVAEIDHERIVELKDAQDKAEVTQVVRQYMNDFKEPLERKGVFVGTWVEPHKLFLDNSHHFTDRRTAFEFARDNNQLAVYNFNIKDTEDTMSDGLRPEDSKGKLNETQRSEDAAASLPTHKMFFDPKMSAEDIADVIVANAKERGIH
jgi:hypothetical protein